MLCVNVVACAQPSSQMACVPTTSAISRADAPQLLNCGGVLRPHPARQIAPRACIGRAVPISVVRPRQTHRYRGCSTAAAKCVMPESLPKKSTHRSKTAANSTNFQALSHRNWRPPSSSVSFWVTPFNPPPATHDLALAPPVHQPAHVPAAANFSTGQFLLLAAATGMDRHQRLPSSHLQEIRRGFVVGLVRMDSRRGRFHVNGQRL